MFDVPLDENVFFVLYNIVQRAACSLKIHEFKLPFTVNFGGFHVMYSRSKD